MQKWLSRLSYSFLILAGWLGWEAYIAVTRAGVPSSSPRVILYLIAAAAGVSLGLAGIRARHRLNADDD